MNSPALILTILLITIIPCLIGRAIVNKMAHEDDEEVRKPIFCFFVGLFAELIVGMLCGIFYGIYSLLNLWL